MLSNLTMIVAVTALVIALLIVVTLFLAIRHDRAVTAAGPTAELEELEARIRQREAAITDMDADIEQRRKALADVAGIQAEVDSLVRQREELLTEWNTLEERRKEVSAVRFEMEEAMTERQSLEADLIEKREEYLSVKERLEKAERLVHQIEALTSEKTALHSEVENLRDEMRRLQDAERRVADLGSRANELEAENARLEGRMAAREAELSEASDRLAGERTRVAEQSAELGQVQANRAAEEQSLSRVKGELAELAERADVVRAQVSGREAKLAQLAERETNMQEQLEALGKRLEDRGALKSELEGELSEIRLELATADNTLNERMAELKGLSTRRGELEARLAYLQGEIARSEGQAAGTGDPTVDPLKELKVKPPVIVQLENLGETGKAYEAESLRNVELRLRAYGLDYHPRILRAFHTAMKVNESTQMAVLAGISGTGKSQLPRQYASAMGIGFLQVPVQPRWDSPQDLMGFYNYIEGKFRPTDMARALWALDSHNNEEAVEDRMMMVLLDEMNLARVEYYFSDFLSRLESRPTRDRTGEQGLRKDAEIELEIPKMENPPRIFPGYNLLFAGTMNEDESTQSLSDKVVDRANILRFAAPKTIATGTPQGDAPEVRALSQATWQGWNRPIRQVENDADLQRHVSRMVDLMRDFKRPFGHRLGRAIMDYVANYPQLDGVDPIRDPVADQVEMRLLPKLRGVEIDEMEQTFADLRGFVENDLGDLALAEAISSSIEAAEATGQFVWSGVTR